MRGFLHFTLPIISSYWINVVFSARCNIYISRLCYEVSVRLSVMEVHCGHGACWEEGAVISRYARHCGKYLINHSNSQLTDDK